MAADPGFKGTFPLLLQLPLLTKPNRPGRRAQAERDGCCVYHASAEVHLAAIRVPVQLPEEESAACK